jgi:hypothetical protein
MDPEVIDSNAGALPNPLPTAWCGRVVTQATGTAGV